MKVFVTGAAGFIGRTLIQKLINQGNEVSLLLRRPVHNLPKGIKIVYGDILSPGPWKDSVKGCSRLYHLAALVSFNPNKKEQLLLTNGAGTYNVLNVSLESGIETTVVVSSACTMGLSHDPNKLIDENSTLDKVFIANDPYLQSKLAAERISSRFSKCQKVIIVNPSTVYGPGDWALNSGTLIEKIANSRILPLFPGGSNVVDVEDVAEGILLAGEYGSSGSRYIIGGQNLTFKEIFQIISMVIGNNPLFIPIPAILRYPLSLGVGAAGKFTENRFLSAQIINNMFSFKYYSIKLAEAQLRFKPKFCFEESIERAWSFYKSNGLIKRAGH